MDEFITLDQHGAHVQISTQVVSRVGFRHFLREAGRPVSARLARLGLTEAPVTEVSQVDALAYCSWCGAQTGRACRLPAMAELSELAAEAAAEGIDLDVWSHHSGSMTEVIGGLKRVWLCEWTIEAETIARPDGTSRVLGSIFYPPWLREGPNATHAQAHLAADQGYSFVTFRVAYDL